MKKTLSFALMTAGPVPKILPARFTRLAELTGPIMGISPSHASRAARGLRAGNPVRDWKELEPSRVFLLSAPAASVTRLLEAMARSPLKWKGRILILDEPQDDAVAQAGKLLPDAAVASITEVTPGRVFLLDGEPKAMRAARSLLEQGGAAVYPMRPGSRALYLASVRAVRLNLPPILDTTMSALRRAGLASRHVRHVAEQVIEQALHSYWKGGRRAFQEPRVAKERERILCDLRVLHSIDPGLAVYHRLSLAAALEAFGKDTTWLRAHAKDAPKQVP